MSDDFCPEHGYEFMKSQWGNPIPYCAACDQRRDRPPVCSWCGTDRYDAAKRHEGPHATWCVHFRESQRGGSDEDRSPQSLVAGQKSP